MRSDQRAKPRTVLAFLLLTGGSLAASACGANRITDPESALISVRLRNDVGASAGRNQVLVTRTDGGSDTRQASVDGAGDITVTGAGTYLIRVIPRAGFVYTDQLRSVVSLSAGDRVSVAFTLYREGTSDPRLPTTDWGR